MPMISDLGKGLSQAAERLSMWATTSASLTPALANVTPSMKRVWFRWPSGMFSPSNGVQLDFSLGEVSIVSKVSGSGLKPILSGLCPSR